MKDRLKIEYRRVLYGESELEQKLINLSEHYLYETHIFTKKYSSMINLSGFRILTAFFSLHYESFRILINWLFLGICSADDLPLENQCQPYIEKAINDLKKENVELTSAEEEATLDSGQTDDPPADPALETNELTSKEANENSIENIESETDTDESTNKNVSEDENTSQVDNNETSGDAPSTEQVNEESVEGSTDNVNEFEGSNDDDESTNEENEEGHERNKRDVSEGEDVTENEVIHIL